MSNHGGATVREQWEFLKDIAELIKYAEELDIVMTAGEAYRPQAQQILYYYGKDVTVQDGEVSLASVPPKSKTMFSRHLDRLAMDFNFFIDKDGERELTYNYDDIEPLGKFWESLNSLNTWGGNWITFKDTPHFERRFH